MRASCRYNSFVQVDHRRARAQPVQTVLSAGHVEPPWADPRWLEHVALEKVLDQRDVIQGEFADEQHIEVAALCKELQQARDSTQVDRVLDEATPDDDPDDDGPRGARRDPIYGPQRFEDLQEAGTVEHLVDGQHPRCKHTQAPWIQSADDVLGEHGQALLGLVVSGQPDREQLQWLPAAVLIGDDVGADLVVQQGLDAVGPDSSGFGDEQPAERHHQFRDVLAHVDVHWKIRIYGTVSIELRTSRFRERAGGDALSVGCSGWNGLEELPGNGRQGLRSPSVELQRPVHEP